MPELSKKLKYILLITLILNIMVIFFHIISAKRNITIYRNNLIEMGNFAIRSFEGSNRLFMASIGYSKFGMEMLAEELSTQQSIDNLVVYNDKGEVLVNIKKDSSLVIDVNIDNFKIVETKNSIALMKPLRPIPGMGFGQGRRFFNRDNSSDNFRQHNDISRFPAQNLNDGHMMNHRGVPPEFNIQNKKLFIGLYLNKSGYNILRKKMAADIFSVIIIEILLMFVLYYSYKALTLYNNTNERLRKAEREAELGKFAGILAHEIKNPLSSIKGLVEFVKMKTADNQHYDYLDRAASEIERLNKIVNDFLSYGREIVLEKKSTDILEVIKNTLILINYEITKKNIKVEVNSDTLIVNADKDKLMQAFMNLILNAVQASGKFGVISIFIDKSNRSVSIKNDVEEAKYIDINKIFEPFFTTKVKGSGLGLPISKKILELHNFSIKITSTSPFVLEIIFNG